jgi:hypothetical protein
MTRPNYFPVYSASYFVLFAPQRLTFWRVLSHKSLGNSNRNVLRISLFTKLCNIIFSHRKNFPQAHQTPMNSLWRQTHNRFSKFSVRCSRWFRCFSGDVTLRCWTSSFRRFDKPYYHHLQSAFHNTLYGEEYWEAMKKYEGVELELHLFSTSTLDQMFLAPAALPPVHVE